MNEKAYCHCCGKKTYIIACDGCGGFGEVTECCGMDDFETTGEEEKACVRCGFTEKELRKDYHECSVYGKNYGRHSYI